MRIKECIMTNSRNYTRGINAPKVGIVVHSTGANNPYIKRYVQPSTNDPFYDAIIADIGKNTNGNDWNRPDVKKGVHAFIGKNLRNEVETYHVLPDRICAWGVGSGSKGSYNYEPTSHIQFEICEDDLKDEKYFYAAMKEAQEYCAYLCHLYGWSPSVIVSHKEAHDAGYGSNHGDPEYWLKKFGKTMNWFREEVSKMDPTKGNIMYIHTDAGVYTGYAVDGVTYAPIRAVAEGLGKTVVWTPDKPDDAFIK